MVKKNSLLNIIFFAYIYLFMCVKYYIYTYIENKINKHICKKKLLSDIKSYFYSLKISFYSIKYIFILSDFFI